MSPQPLEVILYEKHAEGCVLHCRVEIFADSAYVDGDEIEMIFEFRPDSAAKAIEHVESLGYMRSS
jgi:hypothetical protein